MDLPTLLEGWHELHQKANYGTLSVIALQRESSMYYETKLLGLCGAIEALHKGFHPKSLDYRERCVALAQIPPPAAVRQVIPDIEVWAKNIKMLGTISHTATNLTSAKCPKPSGTTSMNLGSPCWCSSR